MKRAAVLILTLMLLGTLTACQDEKTISGALAEVRTDENGDLTALVLERDGKRTGVLLAEKTSFWPMGNGSWTNEEALTEFRKDLQPGNEIRAWCYPRREKLETAEGESISAYWAQSISIEGVLKRRVLTLRDGTAVDVMEHGVFGEDRDYRLPDGTELLWIHNMGGPQNRHVGGVESFDGLSEAVQRKIQAHYDQQAPLYDEKEELEKSYAAYLELGEDFQGDSITQDVSPCASSERVMYFLTSLTLPQERGTRQCYELQLGGAFDRETGEKLDNWDLFAVSEEEARRRLPELCGWEEDRDLRVRMSEALEPEWLVFFPEHVSVFFPPGSLEGEEYGYLISVEYKDAPEGFFQPWAIPNSTEE